MSDNDCLDDMCSCDHPRELHIPTEDACRGKSRYDYPNDCECKSFNLTPHEVRGG